MNKRMMTYYGIAFTLCAILCRADAQEFCDENNYWEYVFDSSRTKKLIDETGLGCHLKGVSLAGKDFSGADLRQANLRQADLRLVDLSGSDLSGANLKWADLSGAILTGANLLGVKFSWADLTGASLVETNLRGGNLKRADITKADLTRAVYDSLTRYSFFFSPERNGMIKSPSVSGREQKKSKEIEEFPCKRSSVVQKEIMNTIGISDCKKITREALSSIEILDLSDRNLKNISSKDFAGLVGLKILSLDYNDLTSLPEDLFFNLTG